MAKRYEIDLSNAPTTTLDSFIDSVFYINLDVNEKSMIGEIGKVRVDSLIAISDKMTNMLHLYSRQGKHLSTIDHVGNGPGEYVRIDDFVMHTGRQTVEVLDGTQNKIIEYSFDGEVKNERALKLSPGLSDFATLEGEYVYSQQIRRNKPEDCYALLITSTGGDVLNRYLPYEHFSDINLSPRNPFYYVEDTLVYLPVYSNVLYNVERSQVYPRYVIDFGEQNLDEKYAYSFAQDPFAYVNGFKDTKGIYFLNVTENTSHLLIDFMYKEDTYFAIIDKATSETRVIKEAKKDNCTLPYAPKTAWKDFYVTTVEREKLEPDLTDEECVNSNPVLLFFKLKQI